VTLPYTRDNGVTTNFGTKIAINAHKCISTRDNKNATTYNRGFSWSTNPKKTFLIPRSKGRCHGNQILNKIIHINHKNCHNFSCKRHIHAEFGFEIGFVPSDNLSVTHHTQGINDVTIATNFGTKIAINAYKCISTRDNENAITYNSGFLWSANPEKTFLIARV